MDTHANIQMWPAVGLSTLLVGAATILLCAFMWLRSCFRVPSKAPLPPGPYGVPLLGYLPFIRRQQHVVFRDIAKKYGAIFRVKLGAKSVVVLNDYKSISDGFSKIQGRPNSSFLEHAGITGVVNLKGRAWMENRRFCVRSLSSGSYGGKSMDQQIEDEVTYMVEKMAEAKGAAIYPDEFVLPSVSNNITALAMGARYDFDDPRRALLDALLLRAVRCLVAGAMITFMPFGAKTLTTLLFTRFGPLRKIAAELRVFFRKELKKKNTIGEGDKNLNFIEEYEKMIADCGRTQNSSFKEEYLVGNVLSLFGAGSQTTYVSIAWHLLNLADKVDSVQRRLRAEVDGAVGGGRVPRWEDRHAMPYTLATVWEMHRWRTAVLLGVPREAEENVVVGGYLIPSGTIVMANIWATHMDPDRWDEPEKFKPERFLARGGSAVIDKPDYLIPFSTGRRMCPAEPLASAEVFVYLATIVQRFIVLPEEGEAIDLSFDSEVFALPKRQKLRFLPR